MFHFALCPRLSSFAALRLCRVVHSTFIIFAELTINRTLIDQRTVANQLPDFSISISFYCLNLMTALLLVAPRNVMLTHT
jgi:hypothetical protein